MFDSHVTTESRNYRGGTGGKAKNPQTVSMAWDERDSQGMDMVSRAWQGVTPQERKEILLGIYLAIPAVSSCVDVIAKRIFSGGFTVEKVDEEGPDNKAHYDQLMEFLLRVSPDWDFNQYGRASITDELIYGETYTEILMKNGLPFNLIKIDCLTMGYQANRWGQIEKFKQQLDTTREVNWLDPNDIIRWWLPHPRASIDPFAPAEKVNDAVLIGKKMINWMTTFFQKGAKFPYYIKFPGAENEADRYRVWFDNNVSGEKNAHRPPIAWGNAEFVSLGNQGAMEMDFQKGLDRMDTMVYGAFGVPPAAVSVIKVGALGGNSGEDQDKSLVFNACEPIKHAFFEKFNDRIVKKGFGITDYRVSSRYADYRSDQAVAQVQDVRIKNGSRTIDEMRLEDGKRPHKIGGNIPIIWSTKEIVPVPRLKDMEGEQKETAQVSLDTQKAQLEKIKNPPALPPALLQNGQPQQGKPVQQPVSKSANISSQNKQQAKEDDSQRPAILQHNTGMMVAFMLDAKTANQLAISGGEPADNLHCTLAFLGDMTDFIGNDEAIAIDALKTSLAVFASSQTALQGRVSGVGRFSPSASSDDVSPVIALVDMQGLHHMRDELVHCLELIGVSPANDFAYTPHITLAYIDSDAPMPIKDVQPPVYLHFDQLCLAVGDERTFFKLEDDEDTLHALPAIRLPVKQQKQESAADTNIPDFLKVWEPPNIEETLAYLASKGVATQTWIGHSGACSEICFPNIGATVKIGESFPGGQRSVVGHPHCECEAEYRDADGNIIELKDAEA